MRSNDPAVLRAGLAAARSQLLRRYVGLGEFALFGLELWPRTTPVQALARIALRDDDVACCLQSRLGANVPRADIPPQPTSIDACMVLVHSARARLLGGLARLTAGQRGNPTPQHMDIAPLLGTCRDNDRRWARRLEWWNEEQHIAFEIGPASVLIAACRAARKELLTSLALLHPEHRQRWGEQIATLSAAEGSLLTELGHGDPVPQLGTSIHWEVAWRNLHDIHHLVIQRLEGITGFEGTVPFDDFDTYRQVTRSLDRDRALAFTIRRSVRRLAPATDSSPGHAARAPRIQRLPPDALTEPQH